MENNVEAIKEKRSVLYQKIMRASWILLGLGIVGVFLFFFFLSKSDLPSLKELEDPKSELASQIFADDISVLGRFYYQNRVAVDYSQLSPNIINALIATEDERYHEHAGIDFRALGRVFVKSLVFAQDAGGGSTITQQLAKLLFTGDIAKSKGERAMQKFKEWIIAVRLERSYTKEEIIAMYLNKFDFINDGIGIKAASEVYFDKQPDELEIEEAAMLVGMLKNPWLYNPVRFPERAKERRDVVLYQMHRNEHLTKDELEYFKARPLDMSNFKRADQSDGLAPYFRIELGKDVKAILKDKRKSNGQPYDLYEDGLKIYTTINPEMQRIAEEEMWKHMQAQQEKFRKRWKKRDIWKYGKEQPVATKRELEIRQQTLTRLVRESKRYSLLEQRYLSDVVAKLKAEIKELRLRSIDIERILKEDKKKGYIDNLLKIKYISNDMARQYEDVRSSQHYKELKTQWSKLQDEVNKQFKKPVKMKVFAYNDEFEEEMTMSPIDSIKYMVEFLQMGSMGVDPKNGHVKYWVGGINHKWFKVDHVRSRRQVGSTFKPFVYSTAIAQRGFSPCFQVENRQYSIQPGEGSFGLIDEWAPANSSAFDYKSYTLKSALRQSLNSVTVKLVKEIGSVEPIIRMIDGMGIDKDKRHPNGSWVLPRVPSISLGSPDLTVQEIAGAYTTFANNGVSHKPIHILKIEDKNGNKLFEQLPQSDVAINPRYNWVMLDLLKGVVEGRGAYNNIKTENGGKTGTTNDYVDGWYVGITPNLVSATWVGGDYQWIRFYQLSDGQGARMARPFFISFLEAVEKSPTLDWDTKARFQRPKGDIGIELDCTVYEQQQGPSGALDADGRAILDDGFGDELIDTTTVSFDFKND